MWKAFSIDTTNVILLETKVIVPLLFLVSLSHTQKYLNINQTNETNHHIFMLGHPTHPNIL